MKLLVGAVRNEPWLQALLLMLGLVAVFLLTHSGTDSSEAVYHYSVAEQIVKHGELGFSSPQQGVYAVAPNGRTYASHEIGNSLLLLPVAWVNSRLERRLTPAIGAERVKMITRFLIGSMGAILCAAGAVCLYLNLRLVFGQSIRTALGGVLLFAFCSFYWSYSRMIFDGVLSGVTLSGAMLCLFLFARRRETWLLAAAFACLGFGLITRVSMILAIAAAGIYLLLIVGPRPKQLAYTALVATATLAPFVAWQLYYNHLRTGSFLEAAVQLPKYASTNALTGNLLDGLAGFLFSPGKSIFLYCPPALLSVFLLRRFWRTWRNETVFVVVLSLFWLLLHAKLRVWTGAWGWGPRYFLTVTPVMALPFLVERLAIRSWLARSLAAAVLLFGFSLSAASVIGNPLYREELAFQSGNQGTPWIWSIAGNQAVDALAGAARNLHTLFFGGQYLFVPGASAATVLASNTLNVWWLTAYRMGVGVFPIAITLALFAICAGFSLWLLLHAGAGEATNPQPRSEFGPQASSTGSRTVQPPSIQSV